MMRLSIVLSVVTVALVLSPIARADTVNIYAAASTSDMLDDIIDSYHGDAGLRIVGTYAASSTLARQIEEGAPADIFLSANEAWMDDLASRQRLAAGTRANLLTNELVLVAPRMLPFAYSVGGGQSLAEVISDGRLAMGDPDGVPAGIYARQTLTHLGQWDALQDHIVYGDSVRAALTWAAQAEVKAAIVYRSDVFSTQSVVRVATFPADSHDPIVYPIAIVAGSEERPSVLAFYQYLRGPEAAEFYEAYGFGRASD